VLKVLWLEQGLVSLESSGLSLPKHAKGSESSSEQWAAKGRQMFDQKNYEGAAHAFTRAGRKRERAVALAYHHQQLAETSTESKPVIVGKFKRAALAFVGCARDALTEKRGLEYYRLAGDCFTNAGLHRDAADAYSDAQAWSSAARQYLSAGMVERALQLVDEHSETIEGSLVRVIRDTARVDLLKKKVRLAPSWFT
jgi:tetratricopeptide (TPR) repeat protein